MSDSDLDLGDLQELAALHLSDREREALGAHLQRILRYVQQLESIDVEGVEPMHYPFATGTRLRADEPRPGLQDVASKLAPQSRGPYFEVPPVMGGDEA